MAKESGLTINKWQEGIGQSPYVGFGQMTNVDIFSKPGSVLISNALKRDTGSVGVVTGLIRWIAQDPRTGYTYHVDKNGTLYLRDTNGAWSIITGHGLAGAAGQGLAIWKDYLFYARLNKLDVYGPLSGAPTWTNNWGPALLSNSDDHPMISSTIGRADDTLYIGNLNFIDTVYEVFTFTFNPANPATYAYSNRVLKLKNGYNVHCLEEFGANIAIGTTFGNNRFNIADTFFWDGFSEAISANQTVRFAEDGVQMMKNVGNVLHTIAGTGNPRIFRAITSNAVEQVRFNNIDLDITERVTLYASGIDQKDGEVMYGIGQNLGAGGANPVGVYSIRNNAYVLRNLISTGRDGSNGTLEIGAVKLISPNFFLVTWFDNHDPDTYGVDILSNNFYTNYSAYIHSPLFTVGTEDDPTTFEKVEVRLGKQLKLGEGIKLKGRKSLNEPFVDLATFDFATYGARYSFDTKVSNISRMVEFQVRIELTGPSNSVESMELKEIVFK